MTHSPALAAILESLEGSSARRPHAPPALAQRERRRCEDVRGHDVRTRHGHAEQRRRGVTGERIEDVRALLVRARRRDGEVAREDDTDDLVVPHRMPDAHAPRTARLALTARAHVAAGIDEVVAGAARVE